MDKQQFINKMQQYKQAKEQNPQLKYWDWKSYADGGIVEDKTGNPSVDYNQQKQWLNTWLKDRPKQMANNIDDYVKQRYYGSDIDRMSASKGWFGDRTKNARRVTNELLDVANTTKIYDYREPWVINNRENIPGNNEFLQQRAGTQAAYIPKYKSIYVSPIAYDKSAILHELTHATQKKYAIQTNAVNNILKKNNQKNDKYLDNPDEVYSRMMQFRYNNSLKPEDTISREQIEQWKKDESLNDQEFIKRYSTTTLEDLLNGVAQRYADGGIVEEDPPVKSDPRGILERSRPKVSGIPITDKPVNDVFNLYDAPVIGDALSIYDASKALKEQDYVGAGLAALGVIPFIPSTARGVNKQIRKHIPEVTRSAEDKINAIFKKEKELGRPVAGSNLNSNIYEDAIESRNRVYESLMEPENINRAKQVDAKYGTNYAGTYEQMYKQYEDPQSYFTQLYEPELDTELPFEVMAQVNSKLGDNRLRLSNRLNNGERKVDTGLIRHEIGHKVDAQATNQRMGNHQYMQDIQNEIHPYKDAQYMIDKKTYDYITKPTEIKSHMNQFRQYLIDNKLMKPNDKIENVPNFFMHLNAAPDSFKPLKLLQNLYKRDSMFKKRFDSIPLTANNNNQIMV